MAKKKPCLSLASQTAIAAVETLRSEYKRLLYQNNGTKSARELRLIQQEMDALIEEVRNLNDEIGLYHSDHEVLGQ